LAASKIDKPSLPAMSSPVPQQQRHEIGS